MPSVRPRRIRHPLAPAVTAALLSLSLAACSDDVATAPAGPAAPDAVSERRLKADRLFERYVSIGTSISAGVASDGLHAGSQVHAWPAQLARLAEREMSLPLIQAPGCGVPLVAPLASGRRIDGSSAAGPFSCAPNVEGIVLPTANVATDGARAHEALFGPNPADAQRVLKNSRILPGGMSQITAMRAQKPRLVSVELGANELLGARSGLVIPEVTVVSFESFQSDYDAILKEVQRERPKAVVLTGLIDDVGAFPAFRSGAELWAQRQAFTAFGIVLTAACGDANAGNLIFVPVKVPTLAATAAATRAPQFYDCGDVAGMQDYTLTPSDRTTINTLLAQMNAYIESEAKRQGYAFFRLGELFEAPGVRVPYSPVQQLMSPDAPYGPFISYDGYHPSAAGQTVLAQAAARALNEAYSLHLPSTPITPTAALVLAGN